jgi:multidrug efflux pump subunit AcrA (membrane-fusion protein)
VKLSRIALATLVISAIVVAALGCSSKAGSTTTTKTQTATVKKGNISLEVTGTGNLAYSTSENLAFEMAGTVEEVMVSAGDSVAKGQELAKLNTSTWDDQVKALQKSLTTAQRNQVTAQRQVAAKQLAVRQAEANVESAENGVSDIAAIKAAQDLVDTAQAALTAAKGMYSANPSLAGPQIVAIQQQLAQAQQNLRDVLSGTGFSVSSDVALQITKALLQVDQANMNLDDAKTAVDDALSAVDGATQAVKDAQSALDDASSLSPIIKAPFAGFITKVNVNGGDDVQRGTVAMQLADPDQFEANILVNEDDIFSVKLAGDATVSLDALNGVYYPAKITAIAPLATVSQGVVAYTVTVELTPRQTASTRQNAAQAQAQSANATAAGQAPSPIQGTTLSAAQSISLKDGLSATVTITIQQESNVLIVPSRSVSRQGQNYVVKVVNGKTTETRTVKTGLTDGTNTEITDGLTEGEQVSYTTGTSSTSSTSGQQGLPGIGGGGPPSGGF